ncbi:monocarboxylate transporter 13-like [Clytia hemisphaerica]|uniref:Major facilitator superfamily (MFS) profile domain-containing protein n=1 Tax=Clytia hemisphaerica TaxID=252671 RepID=A0A7M5WXX7_9CNID
MEMQDQLAGHRDIECGSQTKTRLDRRKMKSWMFSVLVLLVCFFAQALSMGFYVSFGTMFVEIIEIFNTTETRAAWVGSIALSVCFVLGTFSSYVSKKYGHGLVISIGGAFLGLGLLLSSLVADVLSLTLTFSGVTSIGCSLLYFASLSCLPCYFKSNLCIMTSIVCSGSNFSGITFSPLMANLIKQYNLRICFQMFSITALIPIIGGLIIHKYSTQPSEKESEHSLLQNEEKEEGSPYSSLFNNRNYLLVLLSMSLIELCYFIPYIHLVNYGIHHGVSLLQASWLPVILSIGGWCGKIIFGIIGQNKYINITYLFQVFLLAMAVCLTLLPLATTFNQLTIFSVVYGVFDGGFTGFILPLVATTVPSKHVGIAVGTLYSSISIELLFGAPLAGFLYNATKSYAVPFILCGAILLTSAVILFCIHDNNSNKRNKGCHRTNNVEKKQTMEKVKNFLEHFKLNLHLEQLLIFFKLDNYGETSEEHEEHKTVLLPIDHQQNLKSSLSRLPLDSDEGTKDTNNNSINSALQHEGEQLSPENEQAIEKKHSIIEFINNEPTCSLIHKMNGEETSSFHQLQIFVNSYFSIITHMLVPTNWRLSQNLMSENSTPC